MVCVGGMACVTSLRQHLVDWCVIVSPGYQPLADWPALYNERLLQETSVPVVAATYYEVRGVGCLDSTLQALGCLI